MVLLNLLLMMALSAGHAELIVAAINRLHSRPLSPALLKWTRRFHDVAILLFPIVLFVIVGLDSPGILRGGSWRDLTAGWKVYLAACFAGVVSLTCCAAKWQFAKTCAACERSRSKRFDIAAELGRKPIGPGRYQAMARCPGNESFSFEWTQKDLVVPNLPKPLNGLKVLHLSDLHFLGTIDRPFFDSVFDKLIEHDADLVVFSGDLFDNMALIPWLESTLFRLRAPLGCCFVLGNHDSYVEAKHIRETLVRYGWLDVAGKSHSFVHRGETFLVEGTEWPWMGKRPPEREEDGRFTLVVSHSPDEIDWARSRNAGLVLAGHNHGGQIVLPVIGPVYSPSRYGIRYSAGVFQLGRTVMHVSRGLSGRYPLRWNCPPEVTTIVLRCVSESIVR